MVDTSPYNALTKIFEIAKLEHPEDNPPIFIYVGDRDLDGELITIKLEQVPLIEAAKTICISSRLELEVIGNAIIVRTPKFSENKLQVDVLPFRHNISVLGQNIHDVESVSELTNNLNKLHPDFFRGIKLTLVAGSGVLLIEGHRDQIRAFNSIMTLAEFGLLDRLR